MHVISQLSEPEMVKLAVTESSKLLPYVVSSRKTVKLYLRVRIYDGHLYRTFVLTFIAAVF